MAGEVGLGGMAGAYEMRAALGSEHKVTVVNERDDFVFIPSNPWVAFGLRQPAQVSFPIAPHLAKKGIDFVGKRCERIDAPGKTLHFGDGSVAEHPDRHDVRGGDRHDRSCRIEVDIAP